MTSLYTVANNPFSSTFVDTSSLHASLEKGSDDDRIRAMTQIVYMALAGDSQSQLLMDIIRYVLPSKNRQLKKLLHQYWEAVPKVDAHGKLRQEMILVVNAIRNDLQHPNEYIRGGTLRFLTKFREAELLEPLVPTIRECLEHRNSYVRKNALFCILAIAQNEPTAFLMPDAADVISASLELESDGVCMRNGFVALARLNRDLAYVYFRERYATCSDTMLKLAFIDFAAQDAAKSPDLAPTYTQFLLNWLTSTSVVAYEAANALSHLTTDQAILTKVASAYINVAVKETDNSVKITALNQVFSLIQDDNLSSLVMDVLLVLSTPDLNVRKTTLKLALKLVSSSTVKQVLKLLKTELANSFKQNYDSSDQYRSALIETIRQLASTFNESAGDVVNLLLEFLGDLDSESSLNVVNYVKEVVDLHPDKRASVLDGLMHSVHAIRSSRAYLSALWALGDYCETREQIEECLSVLKEAIGPVPFTVNSDAKSDTEEVKQHSTKPKVLADGTYASESPLEAAAAAAKEAERDEMHQLRKLILNGDVFLSGALAATLTKLAIRYKQMLEPGSEANKMQAEILLILASIVRIQTGTLNDDAFDRIYSCINILVQGSPEEQQKFLSAPLKAFKSLVTHNQEVKAGQTASATEKHATRIETPVKFRLFSSLQTALEKPKPKTQKATSSLSQLKQVTQLTGYSDPVYAEALMSISQLDIVLNVMLFNQTSETLEDLKVEFCTTGELKIVEVSPPVNVAPMSFHTARVAVRVTSADSASIFGDISYTTKQKEHIVLLNDIRLNIMDYIRPSKCTDDEFRVMWSKFEWENKVPIQSTKMDSLSKYLDLFMRETHMECLTEGALEESGKFLSANLYARSCFGEDALANLSIELTPEGAVSGHARIRTEQRGPAVSIGDRVALL